MAYKLLNLYQLKGNIKMDDMQIAHDGQSIRFKNQTHTNKWFKQSSYSENWKERSEKLVDMFLKNEYLENISYKVAEYGCGPYAPVFSLFNEKYGFNVNKYDIKKWDEDTKILNLNILSNTIPTVNISIFSGVLEYLDNVPSTLSKVMTNSDYIIMSYAYLPSTFFLDENKYMSEIYRRAVTNGWRNHYTNKELVEIFSKVGVISAVGSWNKKHSLFLLRNFNIDKNNLLEK